MSTTVQKNIPFGFVVPQVRPERPEVLVSNAKNLWHLRAFKQDNLVCVDIETKGTQACNPDCHIVGFSICQDNRSVYFDKRSLSPNKWQRLLTWLKGCKRLVGHNVNFDAGFLYKECNYDYLDWAWDTHGMARQLAGEGFTGQRWGLKWLQIEMLGWKDKGDVDLDNWLISNGHYTGKVKDTDDPMHIWLHDNLKKNGSKKITPDKSKMHLAPPEILGFYCCLDTWSTLQLWHVLMDSVTAKLGPLGQAAYADYHRTFMTSVRLHVSQQFSGIHTDPGKHLETEAKLQKEVDRLTKEFLFHPDVEESIKLHHGRLLDEQFAKQPAKFKKLPKLAAEPAAFTKSGAPSKTHANWCERRDMIAAMGEGEVSKNWLAWETRYDEMTRQAASHSLFNVGSAKQLQWLFYTELDHPVIKTTKNGVDGATDEEAKLQWGEPGMLLIKIDELEKRMTYVRGAYNSAMECGDERIHHQVRMPGTVTCRLAGGGSNKSKDDAAFNCQQQPKDKEHLGNFLPPPGHRLVGRDWDSCEDVVIYEITRDTGFAKIYGPNAVKGNCGYIFTGAQLPIIGKFFTDVGYDPDNPDPEVVTYIKENLKDKRQIAKAVRLGKSYGMGGKLFHNNMKVKGIDIPLDDCYEIMKGLDDVFPEAYKEFPEELMDEWLANGGWILSGLGQPIAVAHSKLKDLPNRKVQRTAHDCHQKSIELVEEVAIEQGLTMMWSPEAEKSGNLIRPWIVDKHDEGIYAVPEDCVDKMLAIFVEADKRLNKWLGGFVKLTGEAEVGDSWSDFM